MNKKQFKKHIKELLRIKKEMEKVENVIRESPLNDNTSTITLGSGDYENLILKILEDAIGDEGCWIAYWLYERDAKFSKKRIITLENGKDYAINSLDDLYNLITKY